ncbi:MAG: GspH/FimT family pseudopilin [Bacillota bacterium]
MAILTDRIHDPKGYTIIELIVVLALFSLLLCITLPNSAIIRSYNENHELRMIEKDLRQARNRAILENQTVMVSFNKVNNQYTVSYSKNDVIKSHKLESGLEITHVGSGDYYFNGTGRVGNPDSVTLKKSNNKLYRIAIQVNTATITLQEVN